MAPPALAQQPPPACVPGTQQTFSVFPPPAHQTYTVPTGAITLLITADGAGGAFQTPPAARSHGARAVAGFPAAGLSSLDVVVGEASSDAFDFLLVASGGGAIAVPVAPGRLSGRCPRRSAGRAWSGCARSSPSSRSSRC